MAINTGQINLEIYSGNRLNEGLFRKKDMPYH